MFGLLKNIRRPRFAKWAIFVLLIINVVVVGWAWVRPDGLLHVYFFNVGQGDSILIRTPAGHNLLVDGGPSSRVIDQIDHVLPIWDRSLDLVILTHPHADHATGLLEALNRYQVKEFAYNGATYASETYQTLLDLSASSRISTQTINSTDVYRFGGVQLDIIHPFASSSLAEDPNEGSIVSQLIYGNFDVLLTGDISINNEASLLSSGLLSDIEVLKVAHQGSRTSTSQNFLEATRPEVSVVSVGSNSYGHPHQQILDRLQKFDSAIYRTDRDGAVEVISDGSSYAVNLPALD